MFPATKPASPASTIARAYEREKRQALDLWAEHLIAVVEGRERVVVPLARA